jgi:hypothetical protein
MSPPHVLADRLIWMRDRQGRDPHEMLDRSVELGVMTSAQANKVRALLDA